MLCRVSQNVAEPSVMGRVSLIFVTLFILEGRLFSLATHECTSACFSFAVSRGASLFLVQATHAT